MNSTFLASEELQYLTTFATSLAIGLLIGLERERRPAAKAGLRTFALVALFGTLAAMLSQKTHSPWLLFGGLLLVGVMTIAAYLREQREHDELADPGTTTVVAILMCYGLGALVWHEESTLAVMLAIVTTILLYFKAELHGLTHNLDRRDLISMLQFAVLTFVILPVLPNNNYGPYEALNPYQIWLMIVLISGISLTGYIALRFTGQRHGAVLLGVFGGLVSSTATTMVFTRRSGDNPDLTKLAVVVILLANLTVLVRLAVISAVISPVILATLLPILSVGLMLGLIAAVFWWRDLTRQENVLIPETKNPAELTTAAGFGILYAVVLLLSAWLSDIAGSGGLYIVAIISGLTDVDAITVSSLRLLDLGKLQTAEAVTAITLAIISNIIFKLGLIFMIGSSLLAKRAAFGMIMTAVGLGGALILFGNEVIDHAI
ncbi:MgtC/SapB family protein [Nitrosomonas communis]|uniref:MgtC/SapB family protein n=1 Tax=Nitrosomonas communis TaxID=44574 RepID=UPI0026EAC4FB|nr:MgtC/SapB family protein [Nitrosomonas communis]MCO6428590.1 MgtC/SapB family protein [Nitrosomonas communis]